MKNNVMAGICLLAAAATGCRKKPDPTPIPLLSTVKLQFEHIVNDKPLVLDSSVYTNANGDSFTVSKYRYYISNIQLTKTDGTVFAEPESYHLIREDDPTSKAFVISNVPAGTYTKIRFLIGVDSLRNVSGAQTGALDPAHAMFWDWDTGYIMAMLEGTTNKSEDGLTFHMGGYKSPNNVLRWATLDLPSTIALSADKKANIHITSDVGEWFQTPNKIDFSILSFAMGGKDAATIADNYADMFRVTHVD